MKEMEWVTHYMCTLWGSYPVLIFVLGLLAFSAFKKLAKLAIFAGVCLLFWFLASNYGVQLPL